MKIGILTFHCAINYGAVLQAYALQEYLKGLGHEVYIIDYRPDYLLKPYRIFEKKYKESSSLGAKLRALLRECVIASIRYKRHLSFQKFSKKKLNLLEFDLNDKSNNIDAFVFGSDQIWNSAITNGIDKIYLGDFPAATNKKLIAYAASMGSVLNMNEVELTFLKSRLKLFSSVSVREKACEDFILAQTHINVSVVLDPILLAGKDIFNSIVEDKQFKVKPYLLIFQLYRVEEVIDVANFIAKDKKLDIVEIVINREFVKYGNKKQTVSPEHFLQYFKNASYVITTSFHGTAFSVLFQKPFNTIRVDSRVDERALSLLQMLGIEERMIGNSEEIRKEDIDYEMVNKRYEQSRMKSKEFILNWDKL